MLDGDYKHFKYTCAHAHDYKDFLTSTSSFSYIE